MAAVLAGGHGAVASHWTAARLWNLFDGPAPREAEANIHVTVEAQRRLHGVVLYRRQLDRRARTFRWSVPVTTVSRTLLDLASVMVADELGRATDEALRRRIVRLADVRRLYEQYAGPGRRRLKPLRTVLAERDRDFDAGANDWELRMDRLWDELGLPAAERQHWVRVGGRRYRIDRAIPELRLAVEWVGGHHAQMGRYQRDRMRISDLVLAGWEVIEIPPGWTPQRIRRTVMTKVAERQLLTSARGKPS
jgi:very-short-patch-repair endonuclease